MDIGNLGLAAFAGMVGGAMNALAGGGTFATLPALIALGLPANIANATSNVALLPGAGTSAWAYRDELGPVAGLSVRLLADDHLRLRAGRQPAARADAERERSTSSSPGCCSSPSW